MAVWPGWGDGARASGPHLELSGELGVGRGAFRGVASWAGGRDAGDVRPDDLQGLSDGPVQAGRGPVVLVVPRRPVEGLHVVCEGHDGADRRERPPAWAGGGAAGDLVRSCEDPPPAPPERRL